MQSDVDSEGCADRSGPSVESGDGLVIELFMSVYAAMPDPIKREMAAIVEAARISQPPG